MRIITLDIETRNIFADVGSNDPVALDIAVVCIHDSKDNSCRSFLQEQLKDLWPILEESDAIVTWNGDHFDIPILNKYYHGDISKIKSIDLMREVQTVLGRRLKLDSVAEATLGKKKSGNGLEAVEWWKNGEVEKIIKYCIDDVLVTRELYDYVLKNNHLKYKDNGALKEIPLNTSSWTPVEKAAMTFSLPF